MNVHDVLYTALAQEDILSTLSYISGTLFDPKAANKLLARIQKTVNRLKEFPESSPISGDEALAFHGIRVAVITPYLFFYKVEHAKHQLIVLRFLHSTRDYAQWLLPPAEGTLPLMPEEDD